MPAAQQANPKVGVIGLGQMGRGIAQNLLRRGLLRTCWDSASAPLETFAAAASAHVAQCPREVAEASDIVIFVVPSSNEIAACLEGPNGVLSAPAADQIILDLTTSDPRETRHNIALANAHGRAYLDAGMSGGAQGADAALLALMVGGQAQDFERCHPVFAAIADLDKVRHVGPGGTGHTMKLIHNMICHSIFMVTSEGCRIAERSGIDLATAIDVINSGNARSFISEQRFPRHILSGTWDARSRVSNLEKDLQLAVGMAHSLEAPAAYAERTVSMLARACEAGMAGDDFSRLYQAFDDLAK